MKQYNRFNGIRWFISSLSHIELMRNLMLMQVRMFCNRRVMNALSIFFYLKLLFQRSAESFLIASYYLLLILRLVYLVFYSAFHIQRTNKTILIITNTSIRYTVLNVYTHICWSSPWHQACNSRQTAAVFFTFRRTWAVWEHSPAISGGRECWGSGRFPLCWQLIACMWLVNSVKHLWVKEYL